MRARLALPLILAVAAGGCDAAGDPTGSKTFSAKDGPVKFTFRLPADFTKAPIDEGDTRGNVVAAAGLTKIDVIAVRRVRGGDTVRAGVAIRHEVQGHEVFSELHPLGDGYALECQYTPEQAEKVRAACRDAVASVARR
jgi:hypothetical protein